MVLGGSAVTVSNTISFISHDLLNGMYHIKKYNP